MKMTPVLGLADVDIQQVGSMMLFCLSHQFSPLSMQDYEI